MHKPNTKTADKADYALVKAAQAGDQNALRELMEKYENTVYGFSFKVCRNAEDAEETLQDSFLNILKSIKSFNFKSSFSTWIYRIVSNSCLMKFRKEKSARWESFEQWDNPNDKVAEPYVIQPESPINEILSNELKEHVDKAILELPPIYRLVFVLKDQEGLKIEEVAETLDISIPAAKARLRRARLFLRERLQSYIEP